MKAEILNAIPSIKVIYLIKSFAKVQFNVNFKDCENETEIVFVCGMPSSVIPVDGL